MPVVTVRMFPGRTVDQKRKLVKAMTDAMIEHADAKPKNLHVIIEEVGMEDWAVAGTLGIDRQDLKE